MPTCADTSVEPGGQRRTYSSEVQQRHPTKPAPPISGMSVDLGRRLRGLIVASSHRKWLPGLGQVAAGHRRRSDGGENFLCGFKPSPAGDGPDCAGRHARAPTSRSAPGRPRALGPPAMRRQWNWRGDVEVHPRWPHNYRASRLPPSMSRGPTHSLGPSMSRGDQGAQTAALALVVRHLARICSKCG
jgi:hypothetical protein